MALELITKIKLQGQELLEKLKSDIGNVANAAPRAAAGLNQMDAVLSKISASGKVSASTIGEFEAAVKKATNSGVSLRTALTSIALSSEAADKDIKKLAASATAELNRLEKQAVSTANKLKTDLAKSGDQSFQGLVNGAKAALSGDALGGVQGVLEGASLGAGAAAVGILALGASLATTTVKTIEFVDAQGDIAEKILNFSDRTGIAVGEVERLSAISQIAGINIGVLETASKGLSNALEDQDGAGKKVAAGLREIGVSAVTSKGQVREIGLVTLEALQALSQIPDTSKRIQLANQILGKGGKELQPLIANYQELQRAVKELGIGLDESGTRKLAEANDEADKLRVALAQLRKEAATRFAPIVISILRYTTDVVSGKNTPQINARGDSTNPLKTVVDNPKGADFRGSHQDEINKVGPSKEDAAFFAAVNERLRNIGVGQNKALADFQASELRLQQAAADSEKKKVVITEEGRKARITELQKEIAEKDRLLLNPAIERSVRPGIQADRAALQKELESLKTYEKGHEAVVRLKEELATLQIKELTGEQQINAEYDAGIKKLKERKEFSAEAAAIEGEIRKERLKQLAKQTAKADQDITRESEINKNRISEDGERARQTTIQRIRKIRLSGGEEGSREDINADFAARIESANREYQISLNALNIRQQIAGEIKNEIDRKKALAEISKDADQNEARRQRELNTAALEDIEARIRLRKKEADEAQRNLADTRAIQRASQDASLSAIRQETELRGQLAVAQVRPGNETAQEVRNANERLSIARSEATVVRQRIAEDRAGATALYVTDGDRAKLEATLKELRLQGITASRDLEAEITANRYDAEIRIANLRKQQVNDFGESIGRAYDAASQKGISGLKDYAKTFIDGTVRTLTVNVAKEAFTATRDKLGTGNLIGGQTDGKGNLTAVGRILSGTPLGTDPAKLVLEANTKETVSNTKAIRDLTGQLRSGGSAAGVPGIPGATIPGIPDLFGGVTASGISTFSGGGKDAISRALGLDSGTSTSSAQSFTGLSGFLGGLKKTGDLRGIFTGISSGPNGAETLSNSERFGAAVGTAGIAVGTGLGVAQGVKQGGTRGALTVTGSLAGGAAAAISSGLLGAAAATGPFAPILAGVALAVPLVVSLLGDPKAKRAGEIEDLVKRNRSELPGGRSYESDTFGNSTDLDYKGERRTSVHVTVYQDVKAWDSKSFTDNSSQIASSVQLAIEKGHELGSTVQRTALGV